MIFDIYHQLGHNYKWNIESQQKDFTGEGFIIAPKYQNYTNIEEMSTSFKMKSFFDPQIFNPHEINEKMKTYDFYPEVVMSGYDTGNYPKFSYECAEKCTKFQVNNNFKFLIIPTIFNEGLPNVEKLTDFYFKNFVSPFLEASDKYGNKKEKILQLVLNSQMIKDPDYSNYLLDWVTGLDEITGVYLIVESPSKSSQIDDPDYLLSLLIFIDALSQNKLITILGYLNTEAVLLSLANPSIITIGSHGNLRKFDHSKFENYEDEPGIKRKTPYVYVPPLLDWIDLRLIQAHLKKSLDFKDYLGKNEYSSEMLSTNYNINAIKTRYYHFFIEGVNQLKEINKFEGKDRYNHVCDLIQKSIEHREKLKNDLGVPLPNEGYLTQWLIAANLFASQKGWRDNGF